MRSASSLPVLGRHVGDATDVTGLDCFRGPPCRGRAGTSCHTHGLKGLVSARGSDEPVSALTSIYEGADLLLYWPYE